MIQAVSLAQNKAIQPNLKQNTLVKKADKSDVSFKDCPNWKTGRNIGIGACIVGLVVDYFGISGLSHVHLPLQDGHEVFGPLMAIIFGPILTFGGAWLAWDLNRTKGKTNFGV